MKKILLSIGAVSLIVFTGCTKNFDQINTDPKQASVTNFDANLLLPTVELQYVSSTQGYNGALLFQSMWVQIFANAEYPTYYSNGDKYVASGNILSYDASIWNNSFQYAGRAFEIQNLVADKPELSNLSGVAVIMEILHLGLVTDVYGDMPFSQALRAKSDNITTPDYDKQSAIYPAMLARLDSVIPTLDASKVKPTNDIVYSGDISKWKKLGYSVMLRMAMRLTKVDPATAQSYVEKAYAGGVFADITDNAFLTPDNTKGYSNGNSGALVVPEDYREVKWSKQLIDYLKSTADPRLPVVAEISDTGLVNTNTVGLAGDNTASKQIGMPNGYDQNGTGGKDISTEPNYPGPSGTKDNVAKVANYSRPRSALYISLSTPGFILTYAETELLLAEAAVRGWNVGATASVHYANGVAAALQSLGTLNPAAGTISAATAQAYVTLNPLDVSSTENSLKAINLQYWATTGTMFNWIESWNNWRRSGYPELTPVVYPFAGNFSDGVIPRREIYPTNEQVVNPAGYSQGANGITGGDKWSSRVWWDK